MKLKDWRLHNSLTQQQAAEMLGFAQSAVARYEAGRVPRPSQMQKIIAVTAGAVTANDFFGSQAVERAA
jgi:transcriptional regulator with XRE-family HTH domain